MKVSGTIEAQPSTEPAVREEIVRAVDAADARLNRTEEGGA